MNFDSDQKAKRRRYGHVESFFPPRIRFLTR